MRWCDAFPVVVWTLTALYTVRSIWRVFNVRNGKYWDGVLQKVRNDIKERKGPNDTIRPIM